MTVFPPLTWARKGAEWLDGKPESQWTLGEFISKSKIGQKLSIPSFTMPMSRPARFCERALFAKEMLIAAPLIFAHPLALPVVLPLLGAAIFHSKVASIQMGLLWWGATKASSFLLGSFDLIVNGPDEFREGEKHAKRMQKLRKQQGMNNNGPQPGQSFPVQPTRQPSVLDKMIALGQMFNGRAGQPTAQQQMQQQQQMDPLQGPAIWGNSTPQYEQPFQVPSEDTVRIASEGNESVAQHNLHYGPQPGHHHGG